MTAIKRVLMGPFPLPSKIRKQRIIASDSEIPATVTPIAVQSLSIQWLILTVEQKPGPWNWLLTIDLVQEETCPSPKAVLRGRSLHKKLRRILDPTHRK
jgi:hypothetical protein